jgi:ABC-type transport system involved in multi-copper enzyme maturation permease subunit
MIRLIRIELLKLRTTRLSYGLLGLAAGLTAFDAVLRAARAGHGSVAPLNTAAGLSSVLTVTGYGMLLSLVLGVTVASGEFRHHTATFTYLATPDRTRVLAAKAVAAVGAGLVFGVVGSAVTSGIGLAFVAALGVGLGSLIRSQLAVVIGVFVWAFFVEPITGGFFNNIGPYLPFTATTTLAWSRLGRGGFGFSGSSSATPLPFLAAAALVVGLAVVVSAVAARTTMQNDIT